MAKEDPSALIWIETGVIHYESPSGGWRVPFSELKVIGEHTDDHGPYADDYFLVFLTADGEYEASFYAEGRDRTLEALGKLLGVELECGLANSVSFQSRVMWHPILKVARSMISYRSLEPGFPLDFRTPCCRGLNII